MRDLEALVERLEHGDLPLEESLAAFERGVALTRNCQTALKEAQLPKRLTDRQEKYNAAVLKRCRMPSVDFQLRRSRLRWLGHVGRMDFVRVPKMLLFARLEGPRPPGRPPKPCNKSAYYG